MRLEPTSLIKRRKRERRRMTGLTGQPLVEAAHAVCRELDPDRRGLPLVQIEAALTSRGIAIARADARKTLGNSLNKHQDLFVRVGPATWSWTPPSYDPRKGLSGMGLAEEAYLVLSRRDPGREGLHYEDIKLLLIEEGVHIRGGNPGNTLFSALQNAKQWFEWVGSGTFRLK
jgi:hypothetical protein